MEGDGYAAAAASRERLPAHWFAAVDHFEASKVMETIHPLVREAQLARGLFAEALASAATSAPSQQPPNPPAVAAPEIDPERVRAAITLALDAALPAMIHEITERVLIALGH